MKIAKTSIGIIAIVVLIALLIAACEISTSSSSNNNSGTTYEIGEIGPGGGIIFYRKPAKTDGWRYLEAGQVIPEKKAWASPGYESTDMETTHKLGAGKENTDKILAKDEYAPAALAAKKYRVPGYESVAGWHLPSSEELYYILQYPYNFLEPRYADFGINSSHYMWSSTENNASSVQISYIGGGSPGTKTDNTSYSIIAVRRF